MWFRQMAEKWGVGVGLVSGTSLNPRGPLLASTQRLRDREEAV